LANQGATVAHGRGKLLVETKAVDEEAPAKRNQVKKR
jgi:hypothetical protein